MNPSVMLHFRVKTKSPLYKWLMSKVDAGETLSDVIRNILWEEMRQQEY